MKKALFFSMLIAIFAFTSCEKTREAVSSNEAAKSMGTACGTALSSLYNSYKANDNKINITDGTTLANVITVSTSVIGLRENGKDSEYRNAYIAGLVIGSGGLLTDEKAANVYDKLLVSIDALTDVNSTSTESKLTAATSAIVAILALF